MVRLATTWFKSERSDLSVNNILTRIAKIGIAPVVVLDRAEDAVPLFGAMQAGGLPCAEITLRTPAGLDSISAIVQTGEDVLVGAGSVLNLAMCKDALSAGAKFIVSPGFDRAIVSHCVEHGVAVLPGCVTPTEIMEALALGVHTVKFFPANVYGGLDAMKALSGPFPGVKFVPTGGVNAANLGQYISAPYVSAVGGSWLCSAKDIKAGSFENITRLCAQAVQSVKQARMCSKGQ